MPRGSQGMNGPMPRRDSGGRHVQASPLDRGAARSRVGATPGISRVFDLLLVQRVAFTDALRPCGLVRGVAATSSSALPSGVAAGDYRQELSAAAAKSVILSPPD